eukprot:Lithocolla_globosa_v1_NODE_11313_length_518_cov_8.496760.p2 type:complete len:108 gc:universal NODE_11313_length_518_cov_8.496760:437-114(-)
MSLRILIRSSSSKRSSEGMREMASSCDSGQMLPNCAISNDSRPLFDKRTRTSSMDSLFLYRLNRLTWLSVFWNTSENSSVSSSSGFSRIFLDTSSSKINSTSEFILQ